MKPNLWSLNHPRSFWQCQPDVSNAVWQKAIANALPVLGLGHAKLDINAALALTLGEGRFGSGHWSLSLPKRIYYMLKPLLPRPLTRTLRKLYRHPEARDSYTQWPIETRYVYFLWEVLAQLSRMFPEQEFSIKPLWPQCFDFSLVLTHDIESARGQEFIRKVADLEESLGFRSSFNFVPEGYSIDLGLMDELRQRGFEIGVHGLTHDGKLFNSRRKFEHDANRINRHLKDLGAVGFRAPLTIRNPEWMQVLNIEYDLSFFDTDPFEPIPGGTMSIWPFFIGHFVELPYTLIQDYTLTCILGERSPRIWLEKVDFLQEYHGMALVNTHPDYLKDGASWDIYLAFLHEMKNRHDCWHALPRDVVSWWKKRSSAASRVDLPVLSPDVAHVREGGFEIAG